MTGLGERILRELELVEAVSVAEHPCYRVWRYRDAPEEMQALSRHGGDEDWLAHCPPDSAEPYWASEGSQFGCCSVSRHDLIDGSFVLIGAHA